MSKVNFIHRRKIVNGKPHNKGGFTVAFREISNGDGVEYAYSFCHPSDNFNKTLGRIKAEGRLNSKGVGVAYMTFDEFRESVYEEEVI